MATQPPIMTHEEHCEIKQPKMPICGGLSEPQEISEKRKSLFEEFRDIIEQKLQEKFKIPKDFKIEAVKVRTQVVNGTNYYFHVRLPSGEFAHVKIYEPLKCYAQNFSERSARVTVQDEITKD